VSAREEILSAFRACVIDRDSGRDPGSVSPSCRRITGRVPADPRVSAILAAAGNSARREYFARSFQRSLWYIVCALAPVLALMFALPRDMLDRRDQVPLRRPGEKNHGSRRSK
jgi:hypothetical protein